MTSRPAVLLMLAAGASACTCAPAPQPGAGPGSAHPARDAGPVRQAGLRGRVVSPARTTGGNSRALEIAVIPEAEMIVFVATRLQEARAALDRLEAARDGARLEAAAAIAEADRADQEWKRTMASDLRSRVEVVLGRPRDPAEAQAMHAGLLARKKASYGRATSAAKRSLAKEHALEELEREARRYRDARHFTRGMPQAAGTARSDASGAFAVDVPPGRYALVALPAEEPGGPGPGTAWLLWIEVREGDREPVLLAAANQHGSDCDACVVRVRDLP